VDAISDPAARLEAIDSVVGGAAFKSPREASEILRRDPLAPFDVYSHVAWLFTLKDPGAALAWALTLPEKYTARERSGSGTGPLKERTLRKEMVEKVAFNWPLRGPEGASGGIEQAPLPKADLDYVMELINGK
jgi:hypothetical protein